jgi:serine/threonine protein kinase
MTVLSNRRNTRTRKRALRERHAARNEQVRMETFPDSTHERSRRRIGTVLNGKWHLNALLGVGGNGTVYSAEHRNGLHAAVKILDARDVTPFQRERLQREGALSNKLAGAGGVQIYDDDETDDGKPYLVMELLLGASLDVLAAERGGTLPPALVQQYAISVLGTLDVAHEMGIVHRDVKPENIFVTTSGDVRLLDFGVAAVAGEVGIPGPAGTPAFMSPEQARGRSEFVDEQSDLYCVGATMFTLLSGEFVHGDAWTTNEMMIVTASHPARSLKSVLPDAPAEIVRIVDRALELHKPDRWLTADEMRAALMAADSMSAPLLDLLSRWFRNGDVARKRNPLASTL